MGVSGIPNDELRCGDLFQPRHGRDFVADFKSISAEGAVRPWTSDAEYVDMYIRNVFEEVRDFAFELEDICQGKNREEYAATVKRYLGVSEEEVERQCADLDRKARCQQKYQGAEPPAYSVDEDPALQNFENHAAMVVRGGIGVINREVRRDALLPDDDVEKQFVAKMCILSAMTTAFPDVKLYCEPFGKALLGTLPEERVVADNACSVVDTK